MSTEPHESLSVSSTREIDRSWLPIYVAIGIIALLFLPITVGAWFVFLALGVSIIRSALTHRREGWMSGVLFGLMLLVPPVVALLYWIFANVFG